MGAMDANSFGLSSIGQIAITVRDVGKAIAFYRDVLGMKLLFEASNMGFFDCNGVRLMLGASEQPVLGHPSSIIYFRVEDIHSAYQSLSSRGVTFEGEPHLVAHLTDHDLWMAFLRDVDNNVLALMSESPIA